jgi:translation initiation factor 1A
MPKKGNGGHGKKFRVREKREMPIKEEFQEYGEIVKILGELRFEVLCYDAITRIAKVRNKMKKKEWCGVGDIVLISLRDFCEEKADILCRYDKEEIKRLRKMGEIPKENLYVSEEKDEPKDTLQIDFNYIEEEELETIEEESEEEEEVDVWGEEEMISQASVYDRKKKVEVIDDDFINNI